MNQYYLVMSDTEIQYTEFLYRHGLNRTLWRRAWSQNSWEGYDTGKTTLVLLPGARMQKPSVRYEVVAYWLNSKGKIVEFNEEVTRGERSLFQ